MAHPAHEVYGAKVCTTALKLPLSLHNALSQMRTCQLVLNASDEAPERGKGLLSHLQHRDLPISGRRSAIDSGNAQLL
jgi:hypothetical protein